MKTVGQGIQGLIHSLVYETALPNLCEWLMSLLIYGAYGYSGRLITREAVNRGLRPLLAGRNRNSLQEWGREMNLPTQTVALGESERLRSLLEDVSVVLHCAGPFARTAHPMVEACLATGTHYFDITGEPEVFLDLREYATRAKEQGVMLLPGMGFDVVPTDCLESHVVDRVPSATTLEVALLLRSGVSRGTLKTMIEQMGKGGLVRRDGQLVSVPSGWVSRTVDFGEAPRTVVSIPEASVVTSGVSTDVPNVTVYIALPKLARVLLSASRYISGILEWRPLRQLLHRLVEWGHSGPSPAARRRGHSVVWAAARKGTNPPRISRLSGPDPYTFTARAALRGVEKGLDGHVPTGFQTPSTAFGPDFVLDIQGVEREDLGDE